jgi:hypothetical protein
MQKFKKFIKYVAMLICGYVVLVWSGVPAPNVDFDDIREVKGEYKCRKTGGKSPSGHLSIDGVKYNSRFSYIFGIHSPGTCSKELNNQTVLVKYLELNGERLELEIRDFKTGRVYRTKSLDQRMDLLKRDLQNKSTVPLVKLCFLIALIGLMAGSAIKRVFTKFIIK